MRLRIDLAYDGTEFHGWATQPGLRTVQAVLEQRIGQLLRLPEHPTLVVAGRTDAGVHARGQVCHLDLPHPLPDEGPAQLHHRLRRALPRDVVVKAVTVAPDPLLRNHVTQVRHGIDVGALNAGAGTLLGLRDFAPFCKPRDGATTIRDLRELSATRHDDGTVDIHLLADAFCHSMVRSLVGALSAVAAGRRDLAWLGRVAASPARHGEVLVMPARGLTLEEVGYPADGDLAARAAASRAVRTLGDS